MECPQHTVALPITQHLHRHLDGLGIEDLLDPLAEIATLFSIVAELVEVINVHTLHEIRSVAIVGKHPDLCKLIAL